MADELVVRFTADVNDLKRGVGEVKQELAGVGESARGLGLIEAGESIKGFGRDLTQNVTMPVLGFFSESIEAASSTEEAIAKFAQIFKGDLAAAGEQWIAKTATEMSRSKSQIRDFAAGFGALLSPAFQENKEKALELSEGYTRLAIDLAAFYDTTDDEAFVALRSGLAGEMEPLKRFGVLLTQDKVEAELMAMGVGKVTSALTANQRAEINAAQAAEDRANANLLALKASGKATEEQLKAAKATLDQAKAQNDLVQLKYKDAIASDKQAAKSKDIMKIATDAEKAQARYNIVMRQTTDAQGQAIRESDGYAQSMKAFMAIVEEIKVEVGTILMPVVLQVLGVLKQGLEFFKNIPGPIKTVLVVIAGLAAALGPVLVVVGSLIGAFGSLVAIAGAGGVGGIFAGLIATISPFVAPVLAVVAAIAALAAGFYLLYTSSESFRNAIGTVVGIIMGALKGAFDWLMGGLKTVMDLLAPLAKAVGDWIGGLVEQVAAWVRGPGQPFIDMLKKIAEVVGGALMTAFKLYVNLLKAVWGPVLGWIADTLLPAFLDALSKLGAWFMSGGTQSAIKGFGELLLKIGGVVVGTVIPGLGKLWSALDVLGKLFRGDVLGAFDGFRKALVLTGDESETLANRVRDAMGRVRDYVRDRLGDARATAERFISGMRTDMAQQFERMQTNAQERFTQIRDAIGARLGETLSTLRTRADGMVTAMGNAWTSVQNAVGPAWTQIRNLVGQWVENVRKHILSWLERYVQTVTSIWTAIRNGVGPAWELIKGTVGTWVGTVRSHIESFKASFQNAVLSIWNAINSDVGAAWETIKATVGRAAQQVVDKIRSVLHGAVTAAHEKWNEVNRVMSQPVVTTITQVVETVTSYVGGGSSGGDPSPPGSIGTTPSGNRIVVRHHAGGYFRAPNGADEGWALLQTGEYIVPRHRAKEMAGGTNISIQINNPTQKSDRDSLRQARSTSRKIIRRVGVPG